MSKVWEPLENSTYLKWARDVYDEAFSELNDWEQGFIDSMITKLSRPGFKISQSQAEKLEAIYVEYTS